MPFPQLDGPLPCLSPRLIASAATFASLLPAETASQPCCCRMPGWCVECASYSVLLLLAPAGPAERRPDRLALPLPGKRYRHVPARHQTCLPVWGCVLWRFPVESAVSGCPCHPGSIPRSPRSILCPKPHMSPKPLHPEPYHRYRRANKVHIEFILGTFPASSHSVIASTQTWWASRCMRVATRASPSSPVVAQPLGVWNGRPAAASGAHQHHRNSSSSSRATAQTGRHRQSANIHLLSA